MSGLPQPLRRFLEKRGSMTASLGAVDDEQSPDIARLMVRAGEALHARFILRDEKDRLRSDTTRPPRP